MMHTFRLMISAERILREGQPLVRFEGKELDYLMTILRGEFSYDQLIDAAAERLRRLEVLHEESALPENPDVDRAEALLREVTEAWEKSHER